ncbi:predicted protein [Chaetoceros tenuissimus]|uniref:Uncharacterized protein n=1 Tax=Chaetoceros tenuissimus TaxID=426638 RepID=A0AAD3HEG5_9STRA|nr:predicted protein [Chaetoceros tenuissimus]
MSSNSSPTKSPSKTSPLKSLLKKRSKENLTDESESSELEDSYLPSSLRFDSTLENFSPTKSLDGIQQFQTQEVDYDLPSDLKVESNVEQSSDEKFCTSSGIDLSGDDSPKKELFPETTDDVLDNVNFDSYKEKLEEKEPVKEDVLNISNTSVGSNSSLCSGEQNDEGHVTDVKISPSNSQDDENENNSSQPELLSEVPQSTVQLDETDEVEGSQENESEDQQALSSTSTNIPKRLGGILRTSSEPRPWSSSNLMANNNKENNDNNEENAEQAAPRKAVSFADENGGIIHEEQTIDVSPSKLSRKVRRSKESGLGFYDDETDKVQKGVMGRVLVLLMDPPSKQYELTSLPYPLVSNEDGNIGPTQLKILLGLVGQSASYEPLRYKTYKAFMRPEDKEGMDNEKTILDYKFIKDEVLVSIPEGYTAEECARFAKPILQDKRLVRLLKKLKRHEKKAEKRKRMGRPRTSMKPERHGVKSRDASSGDDTHEALTEKTMRLTEHSWFSSVANILFLFVVIFLLVGVGQYLQNKSYQKRLMKSAAMEKPCGRGKFCKPFGVKHTGPIEEEQVFMARLRDGIRKWKLENDDLML